MAAKKTKPAKIKGAHGYRPSQVEMAITKIELWTGRTGQFKDLTEFKKSVDCFRNLPLSRGYCGLPFDLIDLALKQLPAEQ